MQKQYNSNYSENYSNSDVDKSDIKKEVILTPISEFVSYPEKFSNDAINKLTPIGHPDPGAGSYYNCHGWSLGYKSWINIKHNKNGDKSFQDSVSEGCAKAYVDSDDIFTNELNTYAKSNTKKLEVIDINSLKTGDIVAYYNEENELTHTARYRYNSNELVVFSSKLGDGHVVEHGEASVISEVYGNIIDYYSVDNS